jgi:pimeloyl-ACP methyl ester carboxylesterase
MAGSDTTPRFEHRKIFVGRAETHVVEGGAVDAPRTLLFLHGWPEDWSEFETLMALATKESRVVAIDLPGVGGSKTALFSGEKRLIARHVMGTIDELGLRNVTLVGHDAGGMVAYACLRDYGERLASVAILSTVIPGLEPWNEVLRNPYVWHFAFHALPSLPELLVAGRQAEYFDYFYRAIAAHPERVTPAARRRYAEAYSTATALTAGFDWYRALNADAEQNASNHAPVHTPLLYVRGAKETGAMEQYARGFRDAGVVQLTCAVVADSGHFTPEEQPEEVCQHLRAFLGVKRASLLV